MQPESNESKETGKKGSTVRYQVTQADYGDIGTKSALLNEFKEGVINDALKNAQNERTAEAIFRNATHCSLFSLSGITAFRAVAFLEPYECHCRPFNIES